MESYDESQMVYCPYNKEHKMLRKKLQQHILKCRVIYKDTVELMVCPFNKGHLIPEPEFFVSKIIRLTEFHLTSEHQTATHQIVWGSEDYSALSDECTCCSERRHQTRQDRVRRKLGRRWCSRLRSAGLLLHGQHSEGTEWIVSLTAKGFYQGGESSSVWRGLQGGEAPKG